MDKEIIIEEIKWLVGSCVFCGKEVYNLEWDLNIPIICPMCNCNKEKNADNKY